MDGCGGTYAVRRPYRSSSPPYHEDLERYRTDPSRWRLRDDRGRQTWHYLQTDDETKSWPQSTADKYFLGLPTELPALRKPDTPLASVQNAISFFSQLQLPPGNWACEYGGPLFLLPGLVISWYVTETPVPEHVSIEIRRYLFARQHPADGGWGLHIEGESSVFGTAMNYVVLRLLGASKYDKRLVKAREMLLKLGGAVNGPHWAKFWLSVLGCMEWDAVNPVPPELWLLPDWVPIAPWRWWIHMRQVFLPMSYIASKGYKYPLTPLTRQLREELYTQPYASIDFTSHRNSISPTDNYHPKTMVLNMINFGLVKVWNPLLRTNFIRRKAEAWAFELIEREDENTDFANLGPVNTTMNILACYIHDGPDSYAVKRHRQRMHDFLWMKDEGMLMNGTNGVQTWDTSFLIQAVVEAGEAEEARLRPMLLKALEFLDDQQIREDCREQQVCYRQRRKGSWAFSTREQGYVVSDCTSEAMKSVILLQHLPGYPELVSDQRLKDAVDTLLTMQNRSGGFASYEPIRGSHYLEYLNAAEVFGRIMIEYDYPECTTAVVTALSLFTSKHDPEYRKDEIMDTISKAVSWILKAQRADGSWYGSWGICFSYAGMFALESLASVGRNHSNDDKVALACKFFLDRQMDDGGWGESYKSCSSGVYTHHEKSQVVQTCWVIIALLEAQCPERERIEKAVKMVMSRQLEDGSWEQEAIEGVFNKSCDWVDPVAREPCGYGTWLLCLGGCKVHFDGVAVRTVARWDDKSDWSDWSGWTNQTCGEANGRRYHRRLALITPPDAGSPMFPYATERQVIHPPPSAVLVSIMASQTRRRSASATESFYIFSRSQSGFIPLAEDPALNMQDPVDSRRSSRRLSRLSAMLHPDLSSPGEFFQLQAVGEIIAGSHRHGQRQPQAQVYEMSSRNHATTGQSTPAGQSTPDTLVSRDSPKRPHSLTPALSGVSVERAEEDWRRLSRHLSDASGFQRNLSTSRSRHGSRSIRHSSGPGDLEKQLSDGSSGKKPGGWSLEDILRSGRAADEEAEIKPKHIGVIWEDLNVKGLGGVKNIVKTFPQAFIDFVNVPATIMHALGYSKSGKQVDILHNFRGVVKPGEMCLVLGRPGSGCTSFLKVIANQRFGYTHVGGEVLYGPYQAENFAKRFQGEAVYNIEDDIHHPTLTVGQTLGFALDVKTPGKRPRGWTKQQFKNEVLDLLLKMFNIEHTRNTIVGNQYTRGVSGGERKRVSIAEMMIASACIAAWDNSTRGLDASTALDYAKSLRVLTNVYHMTTFVSLYQASETIYSQFDKVMVIDEGREVYFGPAKEARAYFESIGFKEKPRQTTPDYLTGCTDPFEREYKEGRSAADAPSTPDALYKAFNESALGVQLNDEMAAYRKTLATEREIFNQFEAANQDAKQKHTSKSSVYSVPFWTQVWALLQRQFLIKWQDKFSLLVSWVTMIVIGLILGTVWLQQPETSSGAFTRGGVLFMALFNNAFQAFGELGTTTLGRPIINKHRAYTFHRPSALWIAQILVDTLYMAPQTMLFSIIVYFSSGLALDAGAFFTFYLAILTAYVAMTLFFRTLGFISPNFDYALKIASVVIMLFVLTSGYLVPAQLGQDFLRWIFWINPMGLAFSAMMSNEFKRVTLTCTESSLVPSGPGYGDIAHQACTVPGSVPGTDLIPGDSYLRQAFQYETYDLWRNYGLILVLITFFLFLNTILSEKLVWGAGGKTVTYFAKEDKERKGLNDKLMEKRKRRQFKEKDEGSDFDIASKAVLTWEDLCYDVPVPSGQLRLLKNIFGYVKPGSLTALMGASGAGKTTLLDVLARRKNIGTISGDVLVDGIAPGTAFQRGTSYAEQQDVHEATQTVREALRFSAELRQPFEVSQEEKYNYVEEVISLLEMEEIADAIIGSPETGLAVEQRKRVTIGVELAAKPELLLFLDEPTSGLDSQSAFNIVLLEYFRKNGAHCPPDANPAEWMLDAVGAGMSQRIGDRDWGERWRESAELANVKDDISQMKASRMQAVGADSKADEREYAAPLWHQIKIVNKRMHIAFWRSPDYGFTRFFNHIAIALTAGLSYLNLDDSRSSLQQRIFVIFQSVVVPALILAQVEPKYDLSRLIFYRESAAKAYQQFPFALSMVLAEMPYSILCAVGFFLPIYFMPGFLTSPSRAGYQFFMILLLELFSVTLGQTIAALTPSAFIALLLNPFITVVFALFCGVTVPPPQIPGFWRSWLYQLDPFTRLIGGMVVTELHDRAVVCTPGELNTFTSPSGTSCGDYMANFFADGGPGYLVDNATELCQYCAYKVGDEFSQPLGLDFGNRWRDLGVFAAFVISNLFLLFLGSRYLNFNRR
ncbi:MAG: hypothetical protein L6R35_000919 [Caloplaca aegaea]|nr:MAG: hypothetical protein L6R35_000919 [Caloplaca aegaea]